jgi:hypothetical protein
MSAWAVFVSAAVVAMVVTLVVRWVLAMTTVTIMAMIGKVGVLTSVSRAKSLCPSGGSSGVVLERGEGRGVNSNNGGGSGVSVPYCGSTDGAAAVLVVAASVAVQNNVAGDHAMTNQNNGTRIIIRLVKNRREMM